MGWNHQPENVWPSNQKFINIRQPPEEQQKQQKHQKKRPSSAWEPTRQCRWWSAYGFIACSKIRNVFCDLLRGQWLGLKRRSEEGCFFVKSTDWKEEPPHISVLVVVVVVVAVAVAVAVVVAAVVVVVVAVAAASFNGYKDEHIFFNGLVSVLIVLICQYVWCTVLLWRHHFRQWIAHIQTQMLT